MTSMCLKGSLGVFRGNFIHFLQVIGKYLESFKNCVLSVEYIWGKVSGKCMKGNKRVTLGPEMFRYWGIIDSGALSWKSQRSRSTGQISTGQVRTGQVRIGQVRICQVRIGQVRIGQVGRAQVGLCQTLTGQAGAKSIFCKYLIGDTMIFGKY